MSATTFDPPAGGNAGGAGRLGAGADKRPGLGRLTLVELRKMTDTRAGFWLQFSVVALTILATVLACLNGHASDHTLREVLRITVQPAAVLLPVIGILLVTSEWSQRTSLVTFTLVPQRLRVLLAKLAAGVLLALIAFVACVGIAAVGTALAAPGIEGTWSLGLPMIGQDVLYLATGMIGGIGFGAVILSSAPAIVLNFVLPLGWAALGSLAALEGAARWLDGSRSLDPMTQHLLSATQWAHVGTTLALWMGLPVIVGAWRIARGEVR